MKSNHRDTAELEMLDYIAIADAVNGAREHPVYGCKMCIMPKGSWQISIVKESTSVKTVMTYQELNAELHNPETVFILIPQNALIGKNTIESMCRESPFVKHVILEQE